MLSNRLNKKIYVGKTKRRLCNRMADHRYFAKKGHKCPISRAIAKYGWENFEILILDECETEEELNCKEVYWINKKRACDPKVGYNIINMIQDHRIIDSDEVKSQISHAGQGRKSFNSKYSEYCGTRLWGKRWYCQVVINRKLVSKVCENEIEAAELYDKIVLFHFGKEAKLNFPKKKNKYLKLDLKNVVQNFVTKKKTSKYEGVSWDASRNRWAAAVIENKKRIFFKRFMNEEDAKNCREKFLTER
jgi:group I intron endonuclease